MELNTLDHIAHELRTPLTLMYSTLQLIERQLPQTKQLSGWTRLYEDLKDMNELVTSLTSGSPAPSGSRHGDPSEWTDLYHLLVTLQDSFLNHPLGCNATIELNTTPNARKLSEHIPCARIPLKEALTNLIKNALEAMATQEKPKVLLSLSSTPSHLQIQVRDYGPGIPEAILSQLYTPYVSGKTSGVGIGLCITRSIIEQQGGTLSVGTGPNGTCFTIRLPISCETETEYQTSEVS